MNTLSHGTGTSFLRRRSTRAIIGLASVAGFTVLGASPVFAATALDCNLANTIDANSGGTRQDIQDLLDLEPTLICLSGTFDIDATLEFDHPSLTLFGLNDALLDGGDSVQILQGNGLVDLTVQNLTFFDGSSIDEDGGAISAYKVTVIDSRFEDNVAGGGDLGGAIAADSVTVRGSNFVGNRAPLGAAIGATQVTVETSTFTSNEAEFGGAISAYAVANVSASTFTGNSAVVSGGAVSANVANVKSSTFVGNTAQFGGAVIASGVAITNSTFVENEAEVRGGAVIAASGTIEFSTFVDNTTGGTDGGQAIFQSSEGNTLQLRGNIITTAPGGLVSTALGEPNLEGRDEASFADLGGNLFSTGSEPAISSVAPSTKFGQTTAAVFNGATLASNGGPTQTLALFAGSPAIGAVPVSTPPIGVDQRGVSRSGVVDAGAFQFSQRAALPSTGSVTSGWVAGLAGLLLAAGAVVFGVSRRRV
jgi:LPXTG-motif cell wall-anchored protein